MFRFSLASSQFSFFSFNIRYNFLLIKINFRDNILEMGDKLFNLLLILFLLSSAEVEQSYMILLKNKTLC